MVLKAWDTEWVERLETWAKNFTNQYIKIMERK